jgi:DNA invertase Pin-like site-specific DNA recombinase
VSGIAVHRPSLDAALARVTAGDVLTVWKLGRLGRSLPHLIETVMQLGGRAVGFVSLSERIDTTTAGGKPLFHIMGAVADFERALIIDRVNVGIAATKKRGKHVSRPRKPTSEQIAHAREAIEGGMQSPAGMAALLGIDYSTLWRAMRAETSMASAMGGGRNAGH